MLWILIRKELLHHLLTLRLGVAFIIIIILGVGIKRYENFLQQAWDYRDTLRDFILTRDAADSDSPHVLFQPGYLSNEPLDHNNIPRVKAKPISLAEGVSAGVVPIAILVLEAFAAFFFALWAFNRTELAG
tara:strand:+ start:114 stop:506 length:393 start_codon:yes stop_codon:yes gene_type:complete